MDVSAEQDDGWLDRDDEGPIAEWTLDELDDSGELESLRCAWSRGR